MDVEVVFRDIHLYALPVSQTFMNFSVVLFYILEILWRTLAIALRLLRWAVSPSFEVKKVQGAVLPIGNSGVQI
jgi:hypothetical protein